MAGGDCGVGVRREEREASGDEEEPAPHRGIGGGTHRKRARGGTGTAPYLEVRPIAVLGDTGYGCSK